MNVWDVSFWSPPLLFIEGCHGLFCHEFSLDPLGIAFAIEWRADKWKWSTKQTDLWLDDQKVWPIGPILGQDTTRWAHMLCIGVMACLKAVW